MAAVVDGLLPRILFKGLAGLLAGRNPGQRLDFPTGPGRQLKLPELARIAGHAIQLHRKGTACFWAFSNSPKPPLASEIRPLSWASSKAPRSAVACTSMNLPEP